MEDLEPVSGRKAVRYLLIAAKIALSAGLIYYAFSKIDVREAWSQVRSITAYAVAGAAVLLLVQLTIAALRLKQILAILGPRCRFIQALDVAFVGAFFSQTLISFVGGDAMRIWRIVRSNVSLGLATKGVVLDRVAGLAGLLALVLLTLPFLLQLVTDPGMRLGLLLALIGSVGGFVLLTSFNYLPVALKKLKLLGWIADLATTAIAVTRSVRGVAILLGLSLVIQMLNVVVIYEFAVGMSIDLTFWHCLLLVPPVMFLSMLPISVAGWGVREGAMIVALGLVGVTPAQSVALSVCFGLGVLAISLPGGMLWLLHRGEYAIAQDELRQAPIGKRAEGSEP